MISNMSGGGGGQTNAGLSVVPTFVLIPANLERASNGNHGGVVETLPNDPDEIKNDLTNQAAVGLHPGGGDQVLSSDEDSILYRSMAIANNQTQY